MVSHPPLKEWPVRPKLETTGVVGDGLFEIHSFLIKALKRPFVERTVCLDARSSKVIIRMHIACWLVKIAHPLVLKSFEARCPVHPSWSVDWTLRMSEIPWKPIKCTPYAPLPWE